MRDPRRDALQHDGQSDRIGSAHGSRFVLDQFAGGDRKPRRGENAMARRAPAMIACVSLDRRRTPANRMPATAVAAAARGRRVAAPCSTSLDKRADAPPRIEKRVDAALGQQRRHRARRRWPAHADGLLRSRGQPANDVGDLGCFRGHRADDEEQRLDFGFRGDDVERPRELRQGFRRETPWSA